MTAASVAAARVLGAFFAEEATRLDAKAEEAGISRLYGGIHYPSDIAQGSAHGGRIGLRVVELASGDGSH